MLLSNAMAQRASKTKVPGKHAGGRVFLVHWNEAEAKERATRLRKAGFEALLVHFDHTKAPPLPRVSENLPDAAVLDLGRLPSHGIAIASALRQRKSTRDVPVVFVDGSPEKVERARSRLPDAVFTDWARIGAAIRRAVRTPPAEPVVPPTMMSGYSGTPLPKKLGIRPNALVAVYNAPGDFERKLGALPEGARLEEAPRKPADLALLFAHSQAELVRDFPLATRGLAAGGKIWLMWPKRTSRLAGDLEGNGVREFGLARGFVDFKVCAVDEDWSGLFFSRRKK